MRYSLWIGLFAILANASAKICWKRCNDDPDYLKSIDIVGCRRRQPTGSSKVANFRCFGTNGPPCFVKRGDVVNLKAEFAPDFVVTDLAQSVFWDSSVQVPWVGLDTNGCTYLEGNCNSTSTIVGQHVKFDYPILIEKFYPSGSFLLKWQFKGTNSTGHTKSISCINFKIRIF